MSNTGYKNLEVWKKAIDMVVMCYETTKVFPKNEIYGLSSQIQRSAVSVPANIAEGKARKHKKEFVQFLAIAYGSLAELETHLYIANRLGYIDTDRRDVLLERTSEIGRMINGLQSSLSTRDQLNKTSVGDKQKE